MLKDDCSIKSVDVNFLIVKVPEIRTFSSYLLKDRNHFYNHFEREIFEEHAPCRFMTHFKIEIYDVAVKENKVNFDVDEFISQLGYCLVYIPSGKDFKGFYEILYNLLMNIEWINHFNNFSKYWGFIRVPLIFFWQTFVKFIRENKTELEVVEFRRDYNVLLELVRENEFLINLEDYPKSYFTPQKVELLKTTVRMYLDNLVEI